MVMLPVSRSTRSTRASGSTSQPMRHPVMQKYFENEFTTTGERLNCSADAAVMP